MATDKDRLKGAIKAAMLTAKQVTNPDNSDQAMDAYANAIAIAVVNEIKAAQVNHEIALTSPSGAVTGTINTTLT